MWFVCFRTCFRQVCCHLKTEIAHYTDSSRSSAAVAGYHTILNTLHSLPAFHTQLGWGVAASPAEVLLLKRVWVWFLSTGARGTAHPFVVRVDAQSSLNHHHAVVVLVAAHRICKGKGKRVKKKGEENQFFKHNILLFFETMDVLISAKHGCLLHSSRLSGFKLGSQSSLGMMLSVRQCTSRTR